MLGATYLMRACLYAVVKNIANARTDMKKADTFIKMPGSFLEIFNAIPALFYKKLDKMEQSPNSISLFVGKKQSFGHIVITNNIINTCPEVAFKWDENLLDIQEVFFNWGFPIKLGEKLPYIPSLEKIDIPLFVPPTQTPSLPVAPITP
jgi:hypothetical protein